MGVATPGQRRWTLLTLVGVLATGVLLTWPSWTGSVRWTPDALFYEAQSRELAGTPADEARHQVFFGPLGHQSGATSGRLEGSEWINYAAPFYRRRWVVPALAAGLRPALGACSLEVVSLLGYLLSGLLAYALARRRFTNLVSIGAAAFVLWFPPLREWSSYPLTDSMGVAALTFAMIAAVWALQGRWPRLLVWMASVLLLSFTRDTAAIAVVAALGLALSQRSRRAMALAGSGALAALPAGLFFGVPLRATVAFTFSNNGIPHDSSWAYIFHEYGTFVRYMLEDDFPLRGHLFVSSTLVALVALLAARPQRGSNLSRLRAATLAVSAATLGVLVLLIAPLQLASLPDPVPPGLLAIAALLPLLAPARGDDMLLLTRYGSIAAVAYLFVLPQATELRLALVVLPFAAIGFARACSWAPHDSRDWSYAATARTARLVPASRPS